MPKPGPHSVLLVIALGTAGFHPLADGVALGGIRLALTVGVLALLIALTGQWAKAMITGHLCGLSVLIAALIAATAGEAAVAPAVTAAITATPAAACATRSPSLSEARALISRPSRSWNHSGFPSV